MDAIVSPLSLSTLLLVTGIVCYRKGMSPPNPSPDDSTRVECGDQRVIPSKQAIPMTLISNYLVMVHFAFELYALWATSDSLLPLDLRKAAIAPICPLNDPSTVQRIHPSHNSTIRLLGPMGLIALGSLIRITCHRHLGRMFTWETSILKGHRLITNGPYGIVRHPAYTGYFFVIIGYLWLLCMPGTFSRVCLIGSSTPPSFTARSAVGISYTLCWALLYADTIVYLVRRSFVEDAMLKREFGQEWDEWANRVRWNVFPYIL